jgi:soluble lytic murein transglycosylase-like protein
MARLNRNRLLLGCSLAITLMLPAAYAALVRAEMDPTPLLQQALRFRVTVNTNRRSGFMTAVSHCRRASEGCDRRLLEFARYLKEAGEANGIDPWLLAAMAFRESGLNPFAVGNVGELGILQLHPRNARSRGVRFVRDQWYRHRCQREAGACQREVVDRAAQLLAQSLQHCGGNLDQALGMYNTGRCGGGNGSYAKRVRGEMEKLKGAVGLPIDQLAPTPTAPVAQAPTAVETEVETAAIQTAAVKTTLTR